MSRFLTSHREFDQTLLTFIIGIPGIPENVHKAGFLQKTGKQRIGDLVFVGVVGTAVTVVVLIAEKI